MKTNQHLALLTVLLGGLASCTFYARNAETYQADTRSLVETRNSALKECYDGALEADENVSGTVVVNFTVEKKTGVIKGAAVDASSTAPESLSSCVIAGLEGLSLDPSDQRDGVATMTWSFEVGAASADAAADSAES